MTRYHVTIQVQQVLSEAVTVSTEKGQRQNSEDKTTHKGVKELTLSATRLTALIQPPSHHQHILKAVKMQTKYLQRNQLSLKILVI